MEADLTQANQGATTDVMTLGQLVEAREYAAASRLLRRDPSCWRDGDGAAALVVAVRQRTPKRLLDEKWKLCAELAGLVDLNEVYMEEEGMRGISRALSSPSESLCLSAAVFLSESQLWDEKLRNKTMVDAIRLGFVSVVEELLQDTEEEEVTRNRKGGCWLELAVKAQRPHVVNVLGSFVQEESERMCIASDGGGLLHLAASLESMAVVEVVLDLIPSAVALRDAKGCLAFRRFARPPPLPLFQRMLDMGGQELGVGQGDYGTILHLAARRWTQQHVYDILISMPPELSRVLNTDGFTAREIAYHRAEGRLRPSRCMPKEEDQFLAEEILLLLAPTPKGAFSSP